MLQELILVFTQFGGGPGDPANNVVRFLLAAFFWAVLFLVSYRMWRSTADRRHLYFSISAAVGASRELFMFTAEYGSFRGYISFKTIFHYYPPLEHAVETLAIILMGYAFLRFYFNFNTLSRLYLIIGSTITVLAYLVTAPLWYRFLDAADSSHLAMTGGPFIGAQFHNFFGDLLFRVIGVAVTLFILASFVFARTRAVKVPWPAFLAFFFFFLDHGLQAVNDLYDDRFAPLFGPTRHCLHTGGIILLVGVYWWEVTQQLRNGKQFLQTLLDALPDHVFYKNSQGVYLGCNQTFAERFFGRPKETIIGHNDRDLISDPVLAERFICTDRDTLSNDASLTYEMPYTLPDGNQVVLETIKTTFHDADGHIAGLIGVSRDITERKQAEAERLRLEQQFHHAQKLESLGVLAGGIAHDFNNILTVILGHCYMAKEGFLSEKDYNASFQAIESAGNRAADLCRQMLTYAGKSPLVQTHVNLSLLVNDVVKMLQAASRKTVTFELHLEPVVPEIKGDTGQIQQIIMNLVINGVEAIGDNIGTVRVSLARTVIQENEVETDSFGTVVRAGGYVCLEVSDTGSGMDAETQKKIFEPFFTTKFTGRGLGMSAIQGIVKAHDAILHLTSTPGIGTIFKICFPVPKVSAYAEIDAATSTEYEMSGCTILLAEDEGPIRETGTILLESMGHTVMAARHGREALEIYRKRGDDIDVILLDLIMPLMGGIDAYHELRAISPVLPIVFCSGYSVDSVMHVIKNDQHADFIHKPYNPSELRDMIVKANGRRRELPP
jgi:PAS domain S-box-containing protein